MHRRTLVAALTGLLFLVIQAAPASAADPVVAAAGDIACGSGSSGASCRQGPTSDLLVQMNPDAVLPLGDIQYERGAYSDFVNFYNPSWGRLLAKTYPAVGNHDYLTTGASGYFDYYNGIGVFNGRAGPRDKGYYSFNVGSWHLISLNSNCSQIGGCDANDPMGVWLKNDLAANPAHCTLVYAHHPRWTSDTRDFDKPEIGPLMQILYDNHVELYVVGHSHFYERFAPTNPSQGIDRTRGFRQLIVGTGGRNVYGFGTVEPASEVRNGNTFGVIKLTLRSGSYDWQFLPIAGQTFTDSGTDVCHSAINDPTPPTAPSNLTAQAVGGSAVDLAWGASSDNVGVAGYRIFRNGTQVATTGATTYRDGGVLPQTTYSYHVVAYDSNGNVSPQSNTANATTGPPDRMVTVTVSEDATVSAAAPSTNFGAATTLEVDSSPVLNTLLKFNVSGVGAGTVTSARIRLYNVESSDSGGGVHRAVSNSWTQGGVTWNTAPAADPVTLGSIGAVQPNTWYEVAVTPAVTGDGPVSFRLDSSSSNGADYSSREGTSGFAARLVLTIADPASDTGPPTAPSSLTANAVSATRVDLAWNASTDDIAVAGYRIFRDGGELGTSTTTSFSDRTAVASTTYSYHVVAYDAVPNVSAPSNTATVTTPDEPPPPPPPPTDQTVTFTASDDATVKVATPGTNFGSANLLEVDNSPVMHTLLKFNVSGVGGGSVTNARLRLYNLNASNQGGSFHRAASSSWSQGTVTWNTAPAADPIVIAQLASVQAGNWYEVDVTPVVTGDGAVSFRIDSSSIDGADYSSLEGTAGFEPRLVVTFRTSSTPDTEPPTAPSGLTANAVSSNRVDLDWSASTDNVGVLGYRIFRNGSELTTTTGTSYTDTTVTASTAYAYSVVAYDAQNASPPSNTANVTTPGSTQQTLTFTATDDATIDQATPTTNSGAATRLFVDNSPVRHTLLKFTVTGTAGRPITSAKIRLHCLDSASNGGQFFRGAAATAWTQSTVNWNNAPAATGSMVAQLLSVQPGITYEVDVASAITGDGTYTFRVTSPSTNGADYSSLEGTAALRPELVVVVPS